jgi:hypothetical protein
MYRTAILASAALLAAAGIAGSAAAHTLYRDSHVLTVRLPDGSLERIHYTGDRPPAVSFTDPFDAAFAPAGDFFGSGSPFAAMERITAAMDRQAEAMFQEARHFDRLAFGGPDQLNVDFRHLPRGAQGYSVVQTLSGNHVCTRSMKYFSQGPGEPPRIETKTSGNCSTSQQKPWHTAIPSNRRADPWHPWEHSNVIQASYQPHHSGKADAGSLRLAEASAE